MNTKARFDQGYDVQQDGDRQIVSWRGDGVSWAAYVVFPLVFLVVLPLLIPPLWFVFFALFLVAVFVLYLSFQQQSLTLTKTAIIKDGQEYDLERVSEFLIDNPMDKDVSVAAQPGLIIGGTGIAGASLAATSLMANAASSAALAGNIAISRSAAKRRFRVRMRYGAKVVTLARNLKQDRAVAIFHLLTRT
ncbi:MULTISPECIES: hypothetical protein [unclassified Yoonia]|uniref:hypothetical protein n=1 Tax=unclassified Yoonia TaxID=2629118 RepID=UPI002AFEBC64|nr:MULTISPECIES: hypothetical protein [unclassified Yoonia]